VAFFDKFLFRSLSAMNCSPCDGPLGVGGRQCLHHLINRWSLEARREVEPGYVPEWLLLMFVAP